MTDRDPTGTDPATGSVPRRPRRRASRPAGPPVDRPTVDDLPPAARPEPGGDHGTAPPAAAVSTSAAVDPEPAVRTKPGRRRTRERTPRSDPQRTPPQRGERRTAAPAPATADDEAAAREQNTRVDKRRRAENERSDRLARTLQTHRKTQLPSDIALRAREYARPDAEDLRQAEAEVVLVRRNYVPPAPLDDNRPGGGRGGRQRRRG